jgi:hypothetical protein
MIERELLVNINNNLENIMAKNPKLVIEILKNIDLPQNKNYENYAYPVPDPRLIKKMIELIDEKAEQTTLTKEIVQLSIKFWYKDHIDLITQKIINIYEQSRQKQIHKIDDETEIVLYFLEKKPSSLPENKATILANQLWQFHNICKDLQERVRIMLIYMTIVQHLSQSDGYRNNIVAIIAGADYEYFEKVCNFIFSQNDIPWFQNLVKDIALRVIDITIANPLDVYKNKFKYLYEKKQELILGDKILTLIKNLIINVAENIFDPWSELLVKLAYKEHQLRDIIIGYLRDAVDNPNYNFHIDRREKMLNVVLEIVDAIKNKDTNVQIGDWLLTFGDKNHLRQIISKYFGKAKSLLGNKFKTNVNARFKDIITRELNQVVSQEVLITILLDNYSDWDKEAIIFFVDMLVRAIQNKTPSLLNMAHRLLTKMSIERVKKSTKKKDLIHAIDSLLATNPNEKEKWEPILKQLM